MTDDYFVQLAPPKRCDACQRDCVRLTTNRLAYGAKAVIEAERRIYFCPYCKASVGLHDGTLSPLGYMADGMTRALRARAHTEFDTVWRHSRMSRNAAYRMLHEELNIPREECHFAMMNKADLLRVIEFARLFQSEEAETRRRREAKKNDRKRQRAERSAALETWKRKQSKRARYG